MSSPLNPRRRLALAAIEGIGTFNHGQYKLEALSITLVGPGTLTGPEPPPPVPPPPPPPPVPFDECPAVVGAPFDTRPVQETLKIGTMNAEVG